MVKGKDNHSKKSRNGSNSGNGGDNHSIRGDKRINKSSDSVTILKEKHREKTRIAVISIIASATLAFSKFIVAVATGSLAILSEALHSGLDIIAAIMTLYAIRMAMRPPDLDHHYGYAKFESLTSLGRNDPFICSCWMDILRRNRANLFYPQRTRNNCFLFCHYDSFNCCGFWPSKIPLQDRKKIW